MPKTLQQTLSLISALVSLTTTSQRIQLKGVRKAVVQCTTTGNWAFSVTVSPDNGTTEVGYNKIITNVTNTNTQTVTRTNSVIINNTTGLFTLDLSEDALESLTVTGTRTSGNWTVGKITLEYF